MLKNISILAAIGLALTAAAAQAKNQERLVAPNLPGFTVGHSAANGTRSQVEEIPERETIKTWTRMVTTQRFARLAERLTPIEYANNILAGLPRACPGATASPVETFTVSGRSAARFKVVCPKGTGGLPESFTLLAIAGKRDMHVKQVAFRGQTTAEDALWGRKFLNDVVFCAEDSKAAVCR